MKQSRIVLFRRTRELMLALARVALPGIRGDVEHLLRETINCSVGTSQALRFHYELLHQR